MVNKATPFYGRGGIDGGITMSIFCYHSSPYFYYSLKKVIPHQWDTSVINMNTHIIM